METISGLPDSDLAIAASGEVTRADYPNLFVPRLEQARSRHERIGCCMRNRRVSGFDAGAAWEDLKAGLGQFVAPAILRESRPSIAFRLLPVRHTGAVFSPAPSVAALGSWRGSTRGPDVAMPAAERNGAPVVRRVWRSNTRSGMVARPREG